MNALGFAHSSTIVPQFCTHPKSSCVCSRRGLVGRLLLVKDSVRSEGKEKGQDSLLTSLLSPFFVYSLVLKKAVLYPGSPLYYG